MDKYARFFFSFLVVCLFSITVTGQKYELVEEAQFRELPNLEISGPVTVIQIDKEGFLWFATHTGLYRYDGNETKAFQYNPNKPNRLAGNWINTMKQDSSGQFFLGIFGVGLQKFASTTEQFILLKPEPIDSAQLLSPLITKIIIDLGSNVWIVTQKGLWRYFPENNTSKYYLDLTLEVDKYGNLWGVNKTGIYLYSKETDQFDLYYKIKNLKSIRNIPLAYIISSRGDLFFSFGETRLVCFSPPTKEWKEYQLKLEGLIYGIEETSEKELLITNTLGEFGMNIFNLKNETLRTAHFGESTKKQLQSSLATFYFNHNIIVTGGSSLGILNILKTGNYFFQIKNIEDEYFSNENVSFNNLPDNQIGLSYHLGVDIKSGTLKNLAETYPVLKSIQTPNTFFKHDEWFLDKQGNYWICTSFSDQETRAYNIYYFEPTAMKLTKKGSIDKNFSIILGGIVQDNKGYIWIGCWSSLLKFHPKTNTYEVINSNIPNTENNGIISGIRTLFKDSDGDIWIGTQNGLYHYSSLYESFQYYVSSSDDSTSLSYSTISCIREDGKGKLWVGTNYGLNAFDKKTKKFTRYYFKNTQNGNQIRSIEINDLDIWFASKTSINQFNPKTGELNTFDTTNGLLNDKFYENKSLKLDNDKLLFAGTKGIDIIDPKTLKKNQHIPPIKITGFSLFNQEVEVMGADSILSKSIVYTKTITLNHDQNVFSFRFAALDYTAPDRNEYAYQMVGFDDDWQYIGTKNEATFTNLDPGVYTFKVKGSNNDGIWNEAGTSLTIIIHPPWYWSWWTKSLYGLFFFGFVYTFYRFQLRRRLAESESLRLRELDDAKNQLYTNITHDFRTPLTIIQGMTEQIKSRQYAQEKRLIQRNTQKLLQMVNQILDLAKLESGKLSLHLQQSDMIAFLKNEMTAYVALATSQNIDLQFQCEADSLEMDFDPFLVRQMLANLLSNALKFIVEDGNIIVRVQKTAERESPLLLLEIEDTGKGIAEDQLNKIFDRYYQVQDSTVYSTLGTGIGLAHTKELVGLMGGKISAKSTLNIGSTFSIELPITQKAVKANIEEISPYFTENITDEQASLAGKQIAVIENFDLPLILIVEDNEDVIQYLIRCLQDQYRILTALNGKEGIQTALEHIPDLIISDVMMPEVDGFTLTETLKNDTRSSHIPIVLLTAKASQEAKIEGLQSGADAYIYKPFDRKEMLVRLGKLLDLRKKLQQHYTSPDQLELPGKSNLSLDEQFLQNVQSKIYAHLDEAEYDVEALAKDVLLSRTQLYRKLISLTNETVSNYIRLIRLKQGERLLQTGQYTVSEVAFKVGFNDPAYFSRRYSILFGYPPSEVNA